MAAEGIQIRVARDDATGALRRVAQLAGDPSPVMAEIAAFLVTATQRHIEREAGPEGRWPRLSPRTAAKRIGRSRRRGYDHMLRVSGRLYASITGDSGPTFAAVGSNAVQAAIQQLGGTIQMPSREQDIHLGPKVGGRRRFVKASAKRKETRRVTIGAHGVTIPARPYLYLDGQDAAEIERIVADAFGSEAAP